MKRLLKLLARLYPSAWRNRYAAEFEALLDDRPPRPHDAFDVLLGALKMQMTALSFVRITLATCLFGLLGALAISFADPAKYVSQSLILVDTGMSAKGRPTGNAAQNDIDPMIRDMTEEALTRSSLVPIIQKYNLYSSESIGIPPAAAITQMRKAIAIRRVQRRASSPGLPGFVLDFSYADPHIAQQVDADLVALFTQANLRSQSSSAPNDAKDTGPPQPGETFMVLDAASLPEKPTFPKRSLFGATGLLAGLAAGLLLAFIIRHRQGKTAANG